MDVTQAQLSTTDGPQRFGMHSVEGYGKTTIGAHFPNPLIVGPENGVPRDLGFQVATLTMRRWGDAFDIVTSLRRDRHPYSSIVFDTVDWMEPLIYRFILDRDSKRKSEMNPKGNLLESIEDYGYGKGYIAAEEEFRRWLGEVDVLQYERGLHVVLLMHTITKPFKNPTGPDYDRYEPKPHARIAAVVKEWVENMLFGYFEMDVNKQNDDVARQKDKARPKADTTGGTKRILGVSKTSAYDAKNRIGLREEINCPSPRELVEYIFAKSGGNVTPQGRGPLPLPQQSPSAYEDRGTSTREELGTQRSVRPDLPADDRHPNAPRDERRDERPGPIEHAQGLANYVTQQQAPRDERGASQSWGNQIEGKSAYHEDRRGDEQRRAQEAMDRVSPQQNQRDERRDANQWTEPNRPQQQAQQPAFRDPAPQNQQPQGQRGDYRGEQQMDVLRALTECYDRAGKFSQDLLTQAQGWAKKAGGDPDRVRAIIEYVDDRIAGKPIPGKSQR